MKKEKPERGVWLGGVGGVTKRGARWGGGEGERLREGVRIGAGIEKEGIRGQGEGRKGETGRVGGGGEERGVRWKMGGEEEKGE